MKEAYPESPNRAFKKQRTAARKRGIEFQFEFEQWCQWWEDNLGPDWMKKRGRKRTQYVMARHGDDGPYHPDNVKCVTAALNCLERAERQGVEHMRKLWMNRVPRKSRWDR